MNFKDEVLRNGYIPTYRIQDEVELLETLPNSKPSKRIINTKKGLNAIKALIDLEKNHNVSWYQYLKEKVKNEMNNVALFYRGTTVTFKEMFEKADDMAKKLEDDGFQVGDNIAVFVSNTCELVYILLAASKKGMKATNIGPQFDKGYINELLNGVSKKAIFISDDNYDMVKDIVEQNNFEKIVMNSLSTSLPEHPELCEGYEKELDSYYHYDDKASLHQLENDKIILYNDYVVSAKNKDIEVKEFGNLDTEFLVTFTSGSTTIGKPKAMVHNNRSLITAGLFHDPELCGNPKIPGLRGLATIHPESNTNIITCISDNLMQGWSVAMEPEYDSKKCLDYIIMDKPNYVDIPTSFIIEMAKQYLIDKKHHENGRGKKLPYLLALFAVGEGMSKGEEKFINKFLRESKAGSGVSMKGIKLPYTTVSIGGGDCEHGGIYYTLWKSLFQKLNSFKLKGQEIGMLPVPFANVTALKCVNGMYVECDYDENGILVANSYTNLHCYEGNPEATANLIITDNLGRNWITCNVYGSIDKVGGVHVKGRIPKNNENYFNNYIIDEIVQLDTKNILSSTTVDVDDKKVVTIQFQSINKINKKQAFDSMIKRLMKSLPSDVFDSLNFRFLNDREQFPETTSGKRSFAALEKMKLQNTIRLDDNQQKETKVYTKRQ